MNRWKNLLAAVCGAVLLAGCSGQEQGLFAFCGGKTAEFAAAFDEAAVESVEYGYTVDTPLQCTVTDEGEIREIFDALSRARVGAEREQRATDSEEFFRFLSKDGESWTLVFEDRGLLLDGKVYELTEDRALWDLARALRKNHKQ